MTSLFEKTRFDEESDITQVHTFADMLRTYADVLYDSNLTQTMDDIHTTLHGVANLIDAHGEKMMNTHCRVHKLNEWASDEVKELREEMLRKQNPS